MTTPPRYEPVADGQRTRWPGFTGLGTVHLYIRVTAVALLLLVTGLAGGMVLERYVVNDPASQELAFPDLEAVADVIQQNYYYRPTSEDETRERASEMEQEAIFAVLSTLDDEYTRYLGADESTTAQEDLEGQYGGTGIDITLDNGLVIVVNVIRESPAEAAGVMRGDVIERINNVPVNPSDPNALVRELRGDIGTVVTLSMVRPSTDAATGQTISNPYEVTLTLEEIIVPPVTWRMIEGTTIGWLRVAIFGDRTVAEVDQAITELKQEGATGIVLDLRGNSGGWVTSAQGVIGRFVDPDVGPALYEDVSPGRGGENPLPILAEEGAQRTDLPLIVLVDGGTASAAEIVAGALKDYDRAIVVGEKTFGKGSVQRIFSFSDGATLRVTVAEWFTPSRGRIQQEGIRPNVGVSVQGSVDGEDVMLETAVELLQSGTSRPLDLLKPSSTPAASPAASPVP